MSDGIEKNTANAARSAEDKVGRITKVSDEVKPEEPPKVKDPKKVAAGKALAKKNTKATASLKKTGRKFMDFHRISPPSCV